jgi:hypothetical protein
LEQNENNVNSLLSVAMTSPLGSRAHAASGSQYLLSAIAGFRGRVHEREQRYRYGATPFLSVLQLIELWMIRVNGIM